MLGWVSKKDRSELEKVRAAYLKRMWEVLEDCTGPRHTGHPSQITMSNSGPAPIVE